MRNRCLSSDTRHLVVVTRISNLFPFEVVSQRTHQLAQSESPGLFTGFLLSTANLRFDCHSRDWFSKNCSFVSKLTKVSSLPWYRNAKVPIARLRDSSRTGTVGSMVPGAYTHGTCEMTVWTWVAWASGKLHSVDRMRWGFVGWSVLLWTGESKEWAECF